MSLYDTSKQRKQKGFCKMVIMCTGSTGFIGSHLCKRLGEGIALVHNDNPHPLLPEALDGFIKVRGDVRDFDLLLETMAKYKVNTVIHLAAHSIVKTAALMPRQVFEMNAIGTLNVLEAARQAKVGFVVVQASDKVYGEGTDRTILSPLTASDPYGTSKVCTDYITQCYAKTYAMKIAVTRPCNVYGYDLANRIVPNTIRACMHKENPVIFKGDTTTRQYLYVSDMVDALCFIVKNKFEGTWNVATDSKERYTQEEVVQEIAAYFSVTPQYVEPPELYEIKNQSIVCNLKEWKAKYDISDGIKETVKEFKKRGF